MTSARMRIMPREITPIGGTRVSSKSFSVSSTGPHDTRRRLPLTSQVQQMVDAIPFWPKVICPSELAQKLGCKTNTINGYLLTCQERALIFQDGLLLSRLKEDLSNVD